MVMYEYSQDYCDGEYFVKNYSSFRKTVNDMGGTIDYTDSPNKGMVEVKVRHKDKDSLRKIVNEVWKSDQDFDDLVEAVNVNVNRC